MASRKIFFGMIAALFFLCTFSNIYARERLQQNSVSWTVNHSNSLGLSAQLEIADFDNTSLIPESFSFESDQSDFFQSLMITTLVAVPNGLSATVNFEAESFTELDDLSNNTNSPKQLYAETGEPGIFRGIRLFPIRINPVQVDENGDVFLANSISMEFSFEGVDDRCHVEDQPVRVSSELRRMLESQILNLDEIDIVEVAPLGRILVVADDNNNVREALEPYVQWKIQQGYTVEVDEPNDTGSGTSIENLIDAAYEDDEAVPLEHVLLVGDSGNNVQAPYRMVILGFNYSDFGYSLRDGWNDMIPEFAIGRLSVRDLTTLNRVVNKTLAYERDVDLEDTDWLENVVLAAGDNSGISPILTNRTIKRMYADRGISADTMWYTMPGGDNGIPDFIVDEVNEGAHFVNYRGFLGMSGWIPAHNDEFSNESRLPIFIAMTCGTGNYSYEAESKSEGIFRAGSGAYNFRGGVICIGTSTSMTHTRFNNVINIGFYDGIINRNIRTVGWSLVNAKLRLFEAYNGTGDYDQSTDFAYWNNLMGDTALRMWVGVPDTPDVVHPAIIGAGQNFVDVEVSIPDGTLPDFCWTTIAAEDVVIDSRLLDASGNARLLIDDPDQYEEIILTVMGDNLVPFQHTFQQQEAGAFVGYENYELFDEVGGDGVANPNENILLWVTVSNFGTQDSGNNLNAVVTSNDPRLEVTGGNAVTIPTLAPGEDYDIPVALEVHVSPSAQDGSTPTLTLTVEDNFDHVSAIPVPVTGWTMTSGGDPQIMDLDGTILPGETTELVLSVKNIGTTNAPGASGTLFSSHEGVFIEENSGQFGNISPGITVDNSEDPFVLRASNNLSVGTRISLTLSVEDENGAIDSVLYTLYIADPRGNGPIGPDNYGYWALDDEDDALFYSTTPSFDWIEISGVGDQLNIYDTYNEDDEAVIVELPFTFSYYGQEFDEITVCSNGWLAFGEYPSIPLFRNWPLPNPNGVPSMVAPLWDDLRTTGGGVYTYHDQDFGMFIVQWNCRTAFNNVDQDFQVILYDTEIWETSTGNGRILFQYQDVSFVASAASDNDYATVGIEDPTQTDGITYSYWGDDGWNFDDPDEQFADAAPVEDGRAILFTDDLGPMLPPEVLFDPVHFNFVVLGASADTSILQIQNAGDGVLNWAIYLQNGELDQMARMEARNRIRESVPSENNNKDISINPSIGRTNLSQQSGLLDKHLDSSAPVPVDLINETQQAIDPFRLWLENSEKGDPGLPGPSELDDSGGPDEFGYVWRDSNELFGPDFSWHDNLGEEITDFEPDRDDGIAGPFTIPFNFVYYAETFNQFWVNTNGHITLVSAEDEAWNNTPLPNDEAPEAIIAPWWDDLDLTDGEGGGEIYFWTNDTDSVVVTWLDAIGWGPRGGPYTFQIILTANEKIKFQYLDMHLPNDPRHDEATIGIQNDNRDIGLTVLHNSFGFINNNYAIEIKVPSIWLDVSDWAGTIQPDSTTDVTVRVSGEYVPLGEYQGSILLSTNDPLQTENEIPVFLAVVEEGTGPVVFDIPDQVVTIGEDFPEINLDDYVADAGYPDNQLQWTYNGNTNLLVQIVNRVGSVFPLEENWLGSETITFTATNPEMIEDSDDVTFTINDINLPPGDFTLLNPTDGDTVESTIVDFTWEESIDPEGEDAEYSLHIFTINTSVNYPAGQDEQLTVDLDSTGLVVESFQEYSWWVIASDSEANITPSADTLDFRLYDLLVEENRPLPTEFAIGNPWPNPFNSTVNVEVALPHSAVVNMQVFDILGREVAQLNDYFNAPGYYDLVWNGDLVSSGIYFFVVRSESRMEVKKAVLLK